MGYDISIVRKNNWDDFMEPSNITLGEWLEYAANDNELNFVEEPGFYNWIGYPDLDIDGTPWFQYYEGYVMTKNPDKQVMEKMLAIAAVLKARVQGEGGEFYDEHSLKDFK